MRLLLAVVLVLLFGASSAAHPGRLDVEGCHQVRQDFKYVDGRTVKAGTRHCHRLLGEIKLDGSESLQNAPHEHRDDVERCMEYLGDQDRLKGERNDSCLGGYP